MSVEEPTSKRPRTELVVAETPQSQLIEIQQGQQRTSNLSAPTMLLTGHKAAVYSVRFNPAGDTLASGSFDKDIFLWDVYGECRNYNVLQGHKNAVLQVAWSTDGNKLVSASADKSVGVWDCIKGKRIRKCAGHSGVVNTVAVAGPEGPQIFASGGDDGTLKLWDFRSRNPFQEVNPDCFQILAVDFSLDAGRLFAAGINNSIQVWDLHKNKIVDVYKGHTDTITGLSLSPDGKHLLSNSMDNTVRMWDTRAFVTGTRESKVFQGALHGSDRNLLRCSWSASGEMVTAGSSDRSVHIWDVPSGQELYYLPGHKATINEVVFHPKEPVIASGGSDKQIYLGELA